MIRVNNNKSFRRSKLVEAIAFADNLSAANDSTVSVSLPSKSINLTEVLFISNKIRIEGKRRTKILMKKEGMLVIEGELYCKSVTFHKKSMVSSSALALLNGSLTVVSSNFVNARVKGLGKISFFCEDSVFSKDKLSNECLATCFQGIGLVEIKRTKFEGYREGIAVRSSYEGELVLTTDEQHPVLAANAEENAGNEAEKEEPMVDFQAIEAKMSEDLIVRFWEQQETDGLVSLLSCLDLSDPKSADLLQTIAMSSPRKALEMTLVEERVTQSKTPVMTIDEVLNWWVEKDIHFVDNVIEELDNLLRSLEIETELYDSTFAALEQLWHKKLFGLENEDLGHYLVAVAEKSPLKAWYLLEKLPDESPVKREALLSLTAGNSDFNWVSYWASGSPALARHFLEMPPPAEANERRVWANHLLDARKTSELKVWYEMLQPLELSIDPVIKFEYNFAIEKVLLSRSQKLDQLLLSSVHEDAILEASKVFKGTGILPGYLRRTSPYLKSIPDIMRYLAPLFTNFNQEEAAEHHYLLLTLFDAVKNTKLNHKPTLLPPNSDNEGVFETCAICYAEKLKPWNQVKLSSCQGNHAFCLSCAKTSMSTGDRGMWGICPGQDEEDKQCAAEANRREMEMCGMEQEKILNILSTRYFEALSKIQNWAPCEFCGGIGGGIKKNKNIAPNCFLCSMAVDHNEAGQVMIHKKLLQGLGASNSYRGQGVFRECYHCAVPIEKGNACATMTCAKCKGKFDFVTGPNPQTHRYDDNGVAIQEYVPVAMGSLWKLGVFKTNSGRALDRGSIMTKAQKTSMLKHAARAEERINNGT